MTSKTSQQSSEGAPAGIGTAEAKRRFSELLDRVGEGERFLVSRRGRPAVALVPPSAELLEPRPDPPRGLATLAGALADWPQLAADVAEIYAARGSSEDRPAPDLG
jgi:prevent-host-death family protein